MKKRILPFKMKTLFKLHRKPTSSPTSLRKGWRWLRPYVIVLMLLIITRFFIVSHIRMPNQQHALVSLTYYGLRLPGESLWGYHRWGYAYPENGDQVVFTCTDKQGKELTLTGICHATPGQVVWIDPVRKIYIPGRTSPDAQPIYIPAKEHAVRVTPYNAHLLAYLMQRYEACNTVSVNYKGELELDGQPMNRVKLLRDYYWIETQPDSFLIVPHDALIGKVVYTLNR